jgi:hypothetical protein
MRLVTVIATSLLVSACASKIGVPNWDAAMTNQVELRAAFEFDCERKSIDVTKITNKSYGAIGCNKKAVYLVSGPIHCTPNLFYGDGELTNDICPVVLNTDIDEKQK